MKKVFYLLSAFSILFFAACSSDDDSVVDDPGNGDENGFTAISLEASADEVEVGESITFTVIADEDEDVTDMATIDIDGSPIEGDTFMATEEGNFEATATLDDLTSNSVAFMVTEEDDDDDDDEDDDEEIEELIIEDGISQFVYLGDFDFDGQMVGEWAIVTANIDENEELVNFSQFNFITEPGNSLNEFSTVFGSILVVAESEDEVLFDATDSNPNGPDAQPTDLAFNLSTMEFEMGMAAYTISATLPNDVDFEVIHDDIFDFIDQTENDGGDRPSVKINKSNLKSAY